MTLAVTSSDAPPPPPRSSSVTLLRPDAKGENLVVADEGIEFLRSLGDTPLAIVAVAGPARTGKSYFLNNVAELPQGVAPPPSGSGNATGGNATATTTLSVEGTSTTGVVAGPDSGFHVGSGVHGVTRGIWLHSHVPDVVRDGKPLKVVFMDTEGFGAPGNLAAFDPKLCFLATVFASAFYYNVIDTINMVRVGWRYLRTGVDVAVPARLLRTRR